MTMRFATTNANVTDRVLGVLRAIDQIGARAIACWRAVRGRVRRMSGDAGMSTAEYAVGTIAACAFAAVLYQVVTGDSIVSALRDLITTALSSLS